MTSTPPPAATPPGNPAATPVAPSYPLATAGAGEPTALNPNSGDGRVTPPPVPPAGFPTSAATAPRWKASKPAMGGSGVGNPDYPQVPPAATTVTATPRLPLRRIRWGLATPPGAPARPRPWCGGVASGVAVHLGLPVGPVRAMFVAGIGIYGVGLLLYLLLMLLVPAGDPWAEAAGAIPPARARLASRLTVNSSHPRLSERMAAVAGGGAFLAAAVLLFAWSQGIIPAEEWLLPTLVVAAGTGLAWSQIDAVASRRRGSGAYLRFAAGMLLAGVGIVLWIGSDVPLRVLLTGILTGCALLASVGLIVAPLWLRSNRAINQAREAEAREAERADIAAHLHDSVLQTLTLIRKRADDPVEVARLARSQERELRAWLYTDRAEAGTSLAEEIREVAAEVEDRYGVGVDVIVVGDRQPDTACAALTAAVREALSNAVRHGKPPVSVYAELGAGSDVYVRDHGAGFELDQIASDRHGVRESIMGRMERHGGGARIRRLAEGTEVHISLPATPHP